VKFLGTKNFQDQGVKSLLGGFRYGFLGKDFNLGRAGGGFAVWGVDAGWPTGPLPKHRGTFRVAKKAAVTARNAMLWATDEDAPILPDRATG
jgi:hypothetical protein